MSLLASLDPEKNPAKLRSVEHNSYRMSRSSALIHLEVKVTNLFKERSSVRENRDMHWYQAWEIRALCVAIRALREDLVDVLS